MESNLKKVATIREIEEESGMVLHAYNLSTHKVEVGRSDVSGHCSWPYIETEDH